MTLLLLLLAVPAHALELQSETVAQIRHDFFGQPIVPLYQYLRLSQDQGGVRIDGYGSLAWSSGLDNSADPDLYQLSATSSESWGTWQVGRQQAVSVIRPWTFDGAHVVLHPAEGLQVGAWGGWSRHQDLDDLADGAGIGRLEARWFKGPFATRLGVVGQAEPGSTPTMEEDIELWFTPRSAPLSPAARALVVAGQPGDPLQWARLELSASPISRLRTTVHAQTRTAIDPTALLGEAIIETFAPDGVDEFGGSLRVSDAHWAAFSSSYALVRYTQQDTTMWGHSVDISYQPGARNATLRVVPGYSFRAGPGGMYHALRATGEVDLDDATAVSLQAAVVPYRKLHDPWATAVTTGLDLDRDLGRLVHVQGGVDVVADALYKIDLRGTLALTVVAP